MGRGKAVVPGKPWEVKTRVRNSWAEDFEQVRRLSLSLMQAMSEAVMTAENPDDLQQQARWKLLFGENASVMKVVKTISPLLLKWHEHDHWRKHGIKGESTPARVLPEQDEAIIRYAIEKAVQHGIPQTGKQEEDA